ncbi:hypothetical protein A5789_03185 [Nocardia sp. 852002-51101_SCH5132738]|nr:hypothetical protein A5789_03185 [Nocardia sp. 852002-51101_SCH5132738]
MDRPEGERILPQQRTRRVRQIEFFAQRTHAGGDLPVPVAGQVREQVMFDLVAQIAAHEGLNPPGIEVRRAQHLAQIPFRLGFRLQHRRSEFLRAVGKMAAEDHQVRPQVAQHIGAEIGEKRSPPSLSAQCGEQHVILACLPDQFSEQRPGLTGALGGIGHPIVDGVQVVPGDTPFEGRRQQHIL